MKGTFAILRRELGALLVSPVAWVLAAFALVALYAAFFFLGFPIGDLRLSGFWSARVASLDVLFAWLPLVYALFAPALTMGAWAEETRSGRDELLFTQPVPLRSIVLGKFLAAWALLAGVTLAAILPLAWVVASIGPLDWGTVAGGVVGALLLAAASTAIGLCASALSSEELVSFLVSAGILIGLWSAALFVRVLPGAFAEVAWYASPSLHFLESGARGILDARDLVYYALFVFSGLVLNTAILEGRRWS